jgi:glycosyltransferase involved in cell wall biosynthesis
MVGTAPGRSGGIAALAQGYHDEGITRQLGIEYISTHRIGSWQEKVWTYFWGMARIGAAIQQFRLIHIHIASWWSFRRLYPIIVLSYALRKKVVLHLHGGQFDTYFHTASAMEKAIIKRGFRAANCVIVLSKDWLERIREFAEKEKIIVIPNGVNVTNATASLEEKSQHRPRVLLFLGDIIRRKGVYDLVKALSSVAIQLPSFEAYICGRGEVDQLRRFAEENRIADRIRIPGWVDGEDKEKLFRNAHAFILPSYAECLPMSMLEAMVRGIPVVATRVGGVPDIIENGREGYLVEPGEINALANAILQLFSDENRWKNMATAAREKVISKFSLNRCSKDLSRLYTKLGAL